MKVFSANHLDRLTTEARINTRERQHCNVHESYQDPCQRLFNAIEPGSYIRPHRHATDPKDEVLIAIRGLMTIVTFDELGKVTRAVQVSSNRYRNDLAVGVEIPGNTWHTVIALEPGCVLFEVKAGPFDPNRPKDLAPWAPEEGSPASVGYLNQLIRNVAY